MKAIILQEQGINGAAYSEVARQPIGPNDVCVKLKTAALNHRDIWTCLRTTEIETPVILGSDGAGVVCELGDGVKDLSIGDEVVINSSLDWEKQDEVPIGDYNKGYKILGYPDHGTFAEYIVIARHQIEPKPTFLDWKEAAAFCLVGITTYRALFTESRLKAGQTVVIPGIGGGAATQALLFAKAAGAKVLVTSRSMKKLDQATQLGADAGILSGDDWSTPLNSLTSGKGADVVVETVGAATWKQSMEILANGGCLVVFGATSGGAVEIDLGNLFLRWQKIIGTTMGSRDEFQKMLQFVNKHKIRPVIDRTFPLSKGVEAMHYLDTANQMGNVILEIDL